MTIEISRAATLSSTTIRPNSSCTLGNQEPAGRVSARVQTISVSVLYRFSVSITHSILAIVTERFSRGRAVPVIVTSTPLTVKAVMREVYSTYSYPQSSFPQRTGKSSTWIMIWGIYSLVKKYSGGTTGKMMLSP